MKRQKYTHEGHEDIQSKLEGSKQDKRRNKEATIEKENKPQKKAERNVNPLRLIGGEGPKTYIIIIYNNNNNNNYNMFQHLFQSSCLT